MHLADHVYAFPLPVDTNGEDRTFHPAGIAARDGLLLVDTGLPHQTDHLRAALAEHGFTFADVSSVLITHQDPDHAGGLAALLEETEATVLAHAADVPAITDDEPPIKAGENRYPAAPVDVALRGGETLHTEAGPVHVVHTPGHTPGHVSLHLPEQNVLIAVDALTADSQLQGPNEEFTPEMQTAVESLDALAHLDFERVLCYHGGLVEEGSDAVAAIFDNLRPRLEEYEKAGGDGNRVLSRELETRHIGLSRFELGAGDRHGSPHDPNGGHRHTRQEELYLVIRGEGRFKVDGDAFPIEEGDAVKIPPYAFRAIEAETDMEFVVAGGPIPADQPAYRDDFWEGED